jgi:hypothetical protein
MCESSISANSVPQGRLKITQDAVPGILTHPPKFSKRRTVVVASFSRPCGTKFEILGSDTQSAAL